MARLWHLGVQEVRPGTYFRTSSGDVTTVGAVNGILAVVCQSNWGPLNEVIDISPEDLNNLDNVIGTGTGKTAVRQGLLGGATMVKAIRVGSGGEKSWRTIRAKSTTQTTRTTDPDTGQVTTTTRTVAGAKSVRIYAKYVGARQFYCTLRKNPLNNGTKQLLIYDENFRVIDNVSFTGGGNESKKMVNAINNKSTYFTAKLLSNNKKIDYFTQEKFGVGTNPKVNVASYTAGTEALERYYWNVIVADSHSDNVNAVLTAFVKQSYELGHLGMAVLGGLKSKSFARRLTYAASINDWRVVYVLNGWLSNTGKTFQGYKAAARIGGMIAACETNASLTHIVVQDAVALLENLTNGQMIQAEQKGCFVLSLNDDDQVWVDNSINTLITLGNDQDEGWKKVRRTKCRFELMTRVNRTCDKLVGRLNNDANGRATIVTAMNSVIREMIGERKLFEGSYAAEDTRYKPVGDRAYFMLVISDIDSLEHIYLDYNFSYANRFEELDTVASA